MNKIFSIFNTPRAASQPTGKIPPQAPEMEQVVLGAIMQYKALSAVSNILKPEMFYKPGHPALYAAFTSMYAAGIPIDLVSVAHMLQKTGELEIVGGLHYLTELTSKVANVANVEYHAQVIAQHWVKRELIKIGNALIDGGYDATVDVFELMAAGGGEIDGLLAGVEVEGGSLADSVPGIVSDIEKAKSGEIKPLTTGFEEMSNLVIQSGDVLVIAGRPGMGKTALALSIAVEMSIVHKIPVIYNSLEMDGKRLAQRLLAAHHGLHTRRLITGDGITVDHVASFYKYADAKMKGVYYRKCRTVGSLRAAVQRLRAKLGLLQSDMVVVVVDYLQLMSGDKSGGSNREQEIASLSRGIKEIAVDENCAVLELSQLSRAVEQRGGDKKPVLSDLRESGSIEQDADGVLFAYRPEYYGLMEDESGKSTRGIGYLIEAKARNGIVEGGQYVLGFRHGMWVPLNDPKLKEEPLPGPRRVDPNYALDNKIEDMPF